MHLMETFQPKRFKSLSKEEINRELETLILLTKKKLGNIKEQWLWMVVRSDYMSRIPRLHHQLCNWN